MKTTVARLFGYGPSFPAWMRWLGLGFTALGAPSESTRLGGDAPRGSVVGGNSDRAVRSDASFRTGRMTTGGFRSAFRNPWPRGGVDLQRGVLLLLTLPAAVQAQFTTSTNPDGTLTLRGGCKVGEVTIPDTINGRRVTCIGDGAFRDCASMTSVWIPSTVTRIEGQAFDGCSGLTAMNVDPLNATYSSVEGVLLDKSQTTLIDYPYGKAGSYTSPDSVTRIGDYAFQWCNRLTAVTLGKSVTSIGQLAFAYCSNLTNVTIPNSVMSIGDSAFKACYSLASIVIPDSVTSIGASAFSECTRLTTVSIPNRVTGIEDGTFFGCRSLTAVTIPNSVTSIGGSAFDGCSSLATLAIPDSVLSIGYFAFTRCASLTSVWIPKGVTSIGERVFYDCSSLTEVRVDPLNPAYSSTDGCLLNKSRTTLIDYPDGRAGSYTIPDSVASIGSYALSNCRNLTSITIPNSVTRIGVNAFYGCTGLTTVAIPDSVTSIADGAFLGCTGLTALTIPDRVADMGANNTFYGCTRLASVTLGNGVTSIGSQAFMECRSLTNVSLPPRVTNIWPGAFQNCASLSRILIPKGVVTLGAHAFSGCRILTAAYFLGRPPAVSFPASGAPFESPTTIYYLPGTPGWGSTFSGRPTVARLLTITAQPEDLTVLVGSNATFSVTATGSPYLSYQWQTNGFSLLGATQSTLKLVNVQAQQAGEYSVVVSDPLGAVTSRIAQLSLRRPDGAVLWSVNGHAYRRVDQRGITWVDARVAAEQSGGYLATITTEAENAFVTSLLVGAATDGWGFYLGGRQEPDLGGMAGQGWTWLNGEGSFPGTNGGARYSNWHAGEPSDPTDPWQPLTIGRFRSEGRPDTWNDEGLAFMVNGYIAEFEPVAGEVPVIVTQPQDQTVPEGGTATFSVMATGRSPLTYLWRTNGFPTQGTSAALVLTNVQLNQAGGYSVVVANSVGAVTSRVATLTVVLPLAIRPVSNRVFVATLAGTGTQGHADGAGATAQFNVPNGGCVDAVGNVYVADGDNHRIRKITPDGTVVTVAGTGFSGYADGPAGTSQFAYPLGVCVDLNGTVYVADTGNSRVRKIRTDGTVSTIAGTGVGGYRDGPGATAWLNFPNDLVVDAAGNLFVTEYDNHTVRRIAPDGAVTTWVGNGQSGYADGPRASARLTQPGGLALDRDGNLYVTEHGGQRVRKVSVSGIVTTLAGTGTAGYLDGEGSQARFRRPDGIVVDAEGYVYVADNGNHTIRRIRPTGFVETLAGTGTAGAVNGFQPVAQFSQPTGIGLLTNGVLCVTDGLNHQVRWIAIDPETVTITSQPQSRNVPTGTNVLFSVAVSGSPPIRYQWRREGTNLAGATGASLVLASVKLAQAGNYSVVVSNLLHAVTSQVAVLTVTSPIRHVAASVAVSGWAGSGVAGFADGPRAEAQFNGPNGGWVDGEGNVYVADGNNHRVRKIAPDGTVTTLAGSGVSGFADGPAELAQFSYPLGVCVDVAGNVYVADAGNNRVRKISPAGVVSTVAGTEVGGYRDGPASFAWLNFPNDLVADDLGNLWVTEFDNHTVRRIAPDGTVSTWVGNGQAGAVDGPRTEARLTQPGGIALDPEGNLYVTEYGGHRVRKVSAAGVVSTVAGTGVAGYLDGEGAKAQFRNPDGIVVGALGYLYVADNGNHAVRRISPTGYVETVAGTGEAGFGEGEGAAAQFWNPTGIGLGANGVLYVTDGMNQRVRRLSPPWLQFLGLGNGLVVNWTVVGWILQVSTNVSLASAWRDVAGQTNGPVVVPIEAAASRFYRLRDVSVSGGSWTPESPANPDPERLVWIPAGTFTMGSPASEPDRLSWEGPQTKVTLSQGFWLGKYEVTQREYEAVMGTNPAYGKDDLDRPVEQVSWMDATTYCARLTAQERAAGRLPAGYEYRLPTEAQWEYACRAGTTTATAFGNSLSSTQANFDGNDPYNGAAEGPSLGRTTKVGSYAPNAWGLYDMHGNVWEWCQDWWSDALPGGSVTDPKGSTSGSFRVSRGGGWGDLGQSCRSAERWGTDLDPRTLFHILGFRAALVRAP